MSWLNSTIDFLWRVVLQIASVFYESSVFILLGFVLAGILYEFVPLKLVARRLGKPGFRSVFWATALGAPLPLTWNPSPGNPRPGTLDPHASLPGIQRGTDLAGRELRGIPLCRVLFCIPSAMTKKGFDGSL